METRRREAAARREVQVEDARRRLAAVPRQHRAGVGLVGLLVLGEAHVAVDAEHRAPGIPAQRRAGVRERGRHRRDQRGERRQHDPLVAGLVGGEPRPVLVGGDILEKGEGIRREAVEGRRREVLVHRALLGGDHVLCENRGIGEGARTRDMITRLAIAGYRSLRDLRVAPGRLTVVTGANGSGKSSLYRALRLLADIAQGRIIASLAAEGGLPSTLWAGPETIAREVRQGRHPVQGLARKGPVSLRLGFGAEDYGYAIDLGLGLGLPPPIPSQTLFKHDPQIKAESLWTGERLACTWVQKFMPTKRAAGMPCMTAT